MPKSRGFTLVELLITISIIAILSAIGLVAYSSVMKQGRDSKRQSDLRSIQSALEQYYSDQGFYPSDITYGSPLSANGKTYLNTIPTGAYCYKSLKPTQTCDSIIQLTELCINSGVTANMCVSYCLYAELENQPTGSKICKSGARYNFVVTPP